MAKIRRVVLFGLVGVFVAAGVIFAVIDLDAADMAASVASFLLAFTIAGVALIGRHSGDATTTAGSETATRDRKTSEKPENSGYGDVIIVGPGGRVAHRTNGPVFLDRVRVLWMRITSPANRMR